MAVKRQRETTTVFRYSDILVTDLFLKILYWFVLHLLINLKSMFTPRMEGGKKAEHLNNLSVTANVQTHLFFSPHSSDQLPL